MEGAFAVSLLVDVAVGIDASDAAACAAGSALGTVLAEPKPRVLIGPAGGAEVPVAQGLAACLVSTDVPHMRLTGVVDPLVSKAPVDWTIPGGIFFVAVLATLARFEVGVAQDIRCRDAHVRLTPVEGFLVR